METIIKLKEITKDMILGAQQHCSTPCPVFCPFYLRDYFIDKEVDFSWCVIYHLGPWKKNKMTGEEEQEQILRVWELYKLGLYKVPEKSSRIIEEWRRGKA